MLGPIWRPDGAGRVRHGHPAVLRHTICNTNNPDTQFAHTNGSPLGDPEPDWDAVQPYNRMARCLRRDHDDEPWRANTIVGATLRDGDFADVAAHVARQRHDPSLLRPTGRFGGIRCDQAHVTPALIPAITDYWQINTGAASDHNLFGFTLDLTCIDRSKLREHT